ncbi:MAG: hypothetical protein MUF60_01345 [Vicinamibacterales bacterium]|nr:hypothetical protein [Vicinamibacterales bacterium]
MTRGVVSLLVLVACGLPAALLAQDAPKDDRKDLVVVVRGEGVYHEPGCPVVKGLKQPAVTMRARAERLGLKPHDCRTAINKALAEDAMRLVWVDLKTKRYHLAGCTLVGTPRAQVSLAHARASYRPCNACKPPQ